MQLTPFPSGSHGEVVWAKQQNPAVVWLRIPGDLGIGLFSSQLI